MDDISDRAAGKVKEVAGVVTNDRSLEAEGKMQHTGGRIKGWFRRRRERRAGNEPHSGRY